MSFQNLYYKRAVGTAKACYVCYRPTTTVLATIKTTDFIYTCPGHLTDPNFASRVKEDAAKTGVTAEEIAKVKEEWEEKERRKKEKEAEAEKAKEKKEGEKKEEGEKESKDENQKLKGRQEGGSASSIKAPSAPATPAPTHERYILHRDFFAMRQAEHRKRRQATQARELAPRLPGAPSGSVV